MKKFVSWNVNGLRACVTKGFPDSFRELNADIFCLQETKLQQGQIDLPLEGYHQYWNYAEKKGYSGTAVFTKEEPISVFYGMDKAEHDTEGRLITLEFPDFYFVCCYTPNAQDGLKRLDYRMKWEDDLREYLLSLKKDKTVIYTGDLNVAHNEIDLKNPKTNRGNAGFSDEEREKFSLLLDSGFTDSFRYLYPELEGAYSWWSYRFQARQKNAGWRIDYFIVSDEAKDKIKEAKIHSEIFGSDHCPVELIIDL
ncbi:MAG: exodeoxyribonuclease III [Clostridia bacterium]|nr:exodeoxyribonuclease III [Clostridia bacterium]